MIIVDSSVWIDYFNGRPTPESDRLDDLLGSRPLALGDIILAEVLQGFRHEAHARRVEALLKELTIFDMLGRDRAVVAAQRYRELRRRGITVRKTADVLIGSFCLSEGHELLASDRDFNPLTEAFGLRRA